MTTKYHLTCSTWYSNHNALNCLQNIRNEYNCCHHLIVVLSQISKLTLEIIPATQLEASRTTVERNLNIFGIMLGLEKFIKQGQWCYSTTLKINKQNGFLVVIWKDSQTTRNLIQETLIQEALLKTISHQEAMLSDIASIPCTPLKNCRHHSQIHSSLVSFKQWLHQCAHTMQNYKDPSRKCNMAEHKTVTLTSVPFNEEVGQNHPLSIQNKKDAWVLCKSKGSHSKQNK